MHLHRSLGWLAVVLVLSCGGEPIGTGGGEGGGSGGGGGEAGGAGGGGGSGLTGDLPCAVANTLTAHCLQCHGPVPSGGSPLSIAGRADLLQPSAIDASKTVAQRSVIRMRQATATMPPAPQAKVPTADIDAFEAWILSGSPAGSCTVDAGMGGGAGGGGGGAGGGGVVAVYDGGTGGLPCNVSTVVAAKCKSCHGMPLAGNATFPLLTRADFLQISLVNPSKTRADQTIARIHDVGNPMPPTSSLPLTVPELGVFDSWVAAGTQAGSCTPTDAGPQPVTCASNQYWTGGTQGSESMEPGYACISCHKGQNFNGQNPSGLSKLSRAYPFMGTAFAGPHEKNLCRSPPPAGGKIEILDKNGVVALTMFVTNSYGNFRSSSLINPVAMPYTARIVANGRVLTMTTPQTSGDCNTCHTEQGLQGAPGRIYWP